MTLARPNQPQASTVRAEPVSFPTPRRTQHPVSREGPGRSQPAPGAGLSLHAQPARSVGTNHQHFSTRLSDAPTCNTEK